MSSRLRQKARLLEVDQVTKKLFAPGPGSRRKAFLLPARLLSIQEGAVKPQWILSKNERIKRGPDQRERPGLPSMATEPSSMDKVNVA